MVVASPVVVVSVFELSVIAVEVISLDTEVLALSGSVVRSVFVVEVVPLEAEIDAEANSVLISVIKVAVVDEGSGFEVAVTSVPDVDNSVVTLSVVSGTVSVLEVMGVEHSIS